MLDLILIFSLIILLICMIFGIFNKDKSMKTFKCDECQTHFSCEDREHYYEVTIRSSMYLTGVVKKTFCNIFCLKKEISIDLFNSMDIEKRKF